MNERRILVVEDQPDLLAAVKEVLEKEGYTVLTARHGAQALLVLEEVCPDLIVADIMMPHLDGYALYEAVRKRAEWTAMPFIFLTAKTTKHEILKGKALGAEDYITKPFNSEELLVVVRARLERAQAIQEFSEEEFDQLKQQIVNVLSHELRTPLTYVRGYTDLALNNISRLAPDELERFLTGIKHGSDRLTQLVEDLLLLIRMDTGQATHDFRLVSKVCEDLAEIVENVAQLHEEKAAAHGLTLRTQIQSNLPPVRLLESFFENALSRLLDNGIKFSQGRGKQVTVSARAADGWVEVAVSDKGVGIRLEEIPNLFQRFRQIDREWMEQQGLGLGLAIARELIRLHGGDIAVESTLGEGSTFTIRLPLIEEWPQER